MPNINNADCKIMRGNKQSGVALVVTLSMISILVATGLGVWHLVGRKLVQTRKQMDMFQAEQWALSGIELAIMVLEQDFKKAQTDSIQEIWADSHKMTAAANTMAGTKDKISLFVTDELSKIQLNALIREFPGHDINPVQVRILEKFLHRIQARLSETDSRRKDMSSPLSMVNSIIDWLDSGDDDNITGITGAESDFYQNLQPPYLPYNRPFNCIDEICNVRSIQCDLLLSLFKSCQTESDLDSLDKFFTVHGLSSDRSSYPRFSYSGKININTASLIVLEALMPDGMEDKAQDLVAFREETSQDNDVFVNLLDKGWYKKVIALSEEHKKWLDKIITYKTNIFRVESSATQNDSKVTLVAFIRRNFDRINDGILSQNTEDRTIGKGICNIIQIQRK